MVQYVTRLVWRASDEAYQLEKGKGDPNIHED